MTPQASAIAVFVAGAVLLLSGSTPGIGDRLELLRRFVPLSILELSHLLGSAVGVALLVLAHGLYRRLDAAWYLTMWLLCAGVILSLLKGFDYEEAIVLGAVAVLLVSARDALSPARIDHRAALLALLGRRDAARARAPPYGWCCSPIGTCPTARSCGGSSLFDRPAPRSLRALLMAAMTAAAYALCRLLRPSKPAMLAAERRRPRARRRAHRECARRHGESCAPRRQESAVQRGAHGLHHVSGLGEQLGVHGRSGGAVGALRVARMDLRRATATTWRSSRCSTRSPRTICRSTSISGSRSSKLGEEARVPLDTFSLEGAARADLRHPHRRAKKDGAEFEIVPRGQTGPIMPELRAVSEAWLAEKQTRREALLARLFRRALLVAFRYRAWCAVRASSSRSPTSGAPAQIPCFPPI